MRERDQQLLSSYVERAADQIEQISDYLRDRNVEDFIDDAQDMARRQPALFVGGAFALGFLMARFLKSSSSGGASTRSYSYGSEWRSRRAERRRTTESRRAGEMYAGGATPLHEETPHSAERNVPIREE